MIDIFENIEADSWWEDKFRNGVTNAYE